MIDLFGVSYNIRRTNESVVAFYKGNECYNLGKYHEAVSFYEAALCVTPLFIRMGHPSFIANILHNLAEARISLGMYGIAYGLLQLANELAPEEVVIRQKIEYMKAIAKSKSEEVKRIIYSVVKGIEGFAMNEAIKYLEEVLSIYPYDQDALKGLEVVETICLKWRAKYPDSEVPLTLLGDIACVRDRLNEAGNTARARDRLNEAEDYYQQALKLNPTDVFALYGLGNVAFQDDDYYDDRGNVITPSIVQRLYDRHGNVTYLRDNFKRAEDYYRRVVKIDPGFFPAQEGIKHAQYAQETILRNIQLIQSGDEILGIEAYVKKIEKVFGIDMTNKLLKLLFT